MATRLLRLFGITASIIAFSAADCYADAGRIHAVCGKIIDDKTNKPIAYATVKVKDMDLWAGADYWTRKQTAYLYPETFTDRLCVITPFAEARRSFLLRGSHLISAELGCYMATADAHAFAAHAMLKYEFLVRRTRVRPSISARYDFATATAGDMHGLTRNVIAATAGGDVLENWRGKPIKIYKATQ